MIGTGRSTEEIRDEMREGGRGEGRQQTMEKAHPINVGEANWTATTGGEEAENMPRGEWVYASVSRCSNPKKQRALDEA